uniref:Uncharacterized protein n=1 Tax=Anguilla anguilla TaxID=7936 RepID=A0A0E9PQQ9_ANGAN
MRGARRHRKERMSRTTVRNSGETSVWHTG